jgi:tetratricopeptide (TPR) repeat protein
MIPAAPARPRRPDTLPWVLGLVSAGCLALALLRAVPWPHLLADYHYWAGREASKNGEAQIVVQREWQAAIALDPHYARVRLDLARSYIDNLWYGGAIAQAEAVLNGPRTRAEASLAWTYLGYCHYLTGDHAAGQAELELAVADDPQNSLAQSVLERLRREGKLPKL